MTISDLLTETPSPYSFDETVNRITYAAGCMEWKIPAVHDLQQTLRNAGKEVLPIKVIELCHPRHSSRILERDKERIVSALMPCRISVYLHSDGKVFISRLNAHKLSGNTEGIINTVMAESAAEIEKIIQKALQP